jgi:Mg2+ and Co2+ transporter CorA
MPKQFLEIKPKLHFFERIFDLSLYYLPDLADLATQAIDAIEIYYTMVADQLNIYNTNMNNKANDVMKVLTIFAAIFIPLTFIAGVYGTNFEYVPELTYKYSYFLMWGVMMIFDAYCFQEKLKTGRCTRSFVFLYNKKIASLLNGS